MQKIYCWTRLRRDMLSSSIKFLKTALQFSLKKIKIWFKIQNAVSDGGDNSQQIN